VQQRRDEQDRAAEAAGDLLRQHRAGELGGVHHERPLCLVELDHRTDGLGQLHGPADILDHRDVPQHGPALGGKQRGGDHLEGGVLSALHEDRALQRVASSHAIAGL